jgi:PAS domain S-box-containing protein
MIKPTENNNFERERLVSLINSMADAVIAVDEHCSVVVYNGAALEILDTNVIKIGSKLSSLIKLHNAQAQSVDITKLILATKTSTSGREHRLIYPSGEKINIYLSIAPIHLGYNKEGARGFVILLRDITHEKSLEEERDEFISVISHELRTPVAIAEGSLSNLVFIMQKNNIDQQMIKYVSQSYNQVTYLSSMINDLSTLARAERGKLELNVDKINVYELVKEISRNYQASAEQKNLHLNVLPAHDLDLLSSSRLYLAEILQNFITNAIKYTETGRVTLTAKKCPNGVKFNIIDTGIGIGKSDINKIFEKFYRSEDFRTRKNSGTGIGLYVTVKLAKKINAQISVTSELNKGSNFELVVPNI